MTTAAAAALAVRVSLRRPDGEVAERIRCCWRNAPTTADVLHELAGRALTARRRGLCLVVDHAPDDLAVVLRLAGLS